jgi:DNA-binding transcriptional LysR family regulator
MFLRQLEYLIALSQEKHFSRAARRCNVSQPSLSNALKQLEAELGTPIILRHQRFQGFTAEGIRIVEWCKRILADRNAMLQELALLRKNLSGRLRLGAMPTSTMVLPIFVKEFQTQHPGVQIEISFMGLDKLRAGLTNFDLDAGITYLDQQFDPLATHAIYREHLVLLVPSNDRFPSASTITWAEAAKFPLCLLSKHMHERQLIDDAFKQAGVHPEPRVQSDSIVNLAFHVMQGEMATIVPSHFVHASEVFTRARVIRLVRPEVSRDIGLVWVEGDPMLPMAKALLETLKDMAASGALAQKLSGPMKTTSTSVKR